VIELPPEEDSPVQSLYADDIAIVINGTALLTRPKSNNKKQQTPTTGTRANEVKSIPYPFFYRFAIYRIIQNFWNQFIGHLNTLAWQVVEAPAQVHGRPVVLEGSDVLFTGREIFVGIRKSGTNTEGALVGKINLIICWWHWDFPQIVAKTFADFSVIPIPVSGNLPLKYHISVATNEILAVNKEKESQNILKVLSILIAFSGLSTVQRIERDATYRYKVLTIENEQASSCLNVNNRLIFRHDLNELVNLWLCHPIPFGTSTQKFRVLQPPTELWGVTVDELIKLGAPFSRYCLLVHKLSTRRHD
jgi:hypothetical protein